MQISDVFELPLDEHGVVELCDSIATNPDGNEKEISAIMQAVNSFDCLQKENDQWRFCAEHTTGTYGYGIYYQPVYMLEHLIATYDMDADDCSKIVELLKKASGQ